MNGIGKFFYHICAYTTVICALFYLCAALFSLEDISLSFGRFFLILAFGAVISIAELIFSISRLNNALKYIIHFTSLFAVFLIAFATIKNQSGQTFGFTSFMTALLIYTAVYLPVFLVLKIFRYTSAKIKKKTETKSDSTYRKRFNTPD